MPLARIAMPTGAWVGEEFEPSLRHLFPVLRDLVTVALEGVEGVELDDLVQIRLGLVQGLADVLEDISGLDLDVDNADRLAVFIRRDLSADKEERPALPA